ncbi:MAG: hypothetical protein HWD86_10965 [Kangiellaceae bacterium]|nr:hypothetical protein [Kangiellaceae bacterium]
MIEYVGKQLLISKLDAAKRQLETVIELYFSHKDPVSIHTLTAASYNILRDLNKSEKHPPLFIKDRFLNYIKPGYEKEVRNLINQAENFFKHADRDREDIFEFNPKQTELMIYEACDSYRALSGEFPAKFKCYSMWFSSRYPNLFELPNDYLDLVMKNQREVEDDRREIFYSEALSILNKTSMNTS